MRQVFAITLRSTDGSVKQINVLVAGKIRDAIAHAEDANAGWEAVGGNPLGVVHLEVPEK